jgi:hypothetical protein
MPNRIITAISLLKDKVDTVKHFLIVVTVYALFNIANHYVTQSLYFETGAHLIHVPSGVRMVIVLIAGISGAAAIGIASFPYAYWYLFNENLLVATTVSITTALIPFITVLVAKRLMSWQDDFADLTLGKLFIIAISYSVANATVQQSIYFLFGLAARPLNAWFVMFTGDILGILIVLYLMRIIAKIIRLRRLS